MSMQLRSALKKAVEKYNKYRSPEAVARVAHVGDDGFELEFTGPFCQSCGVQDYFEDMIYELRDVSDVKADLVEVTEIEQGTYRVRYRTESA